tara:strand:- start:687 stop:1739 length:1053 start_codon:yes stop_codon:yes gene_type:complete
MPIERINTIETNNSSNGNIESNEKYAIIKYVNDNVKCRINDNEYNECRLCYEESTQENPFLFPCKCAGTMKFIHEKCLNQWRNENIDNMNFHKCNQCNAFYQKSFPKPMEKYFLFSYKYNILLRFYFPALFMFIILTFYNDYNGRITDLIKYDKSGNITSLIKNSEYNFTVYYFGFSMNCSIDLFFIYYIALMLNCINNRCKFINKIKYDLLSKIFFSNGFFLLMAMFIPNQSYSVFFILLNIYIILSPIYAHLIYSDTKKVIKEMNIENKVIIFNYDRDYDNQINRNFENFINNIIDNMDNDNNIDNFNFNNGINNHINQEPLNHINDMRRNNHRNREYRRVYVYEMNN